MRAPIPNLTKKEIVWLHGHKCKHRHTYIEHYECYLKERKDGERIGFLDIEASNLKADFGIVFSYCIKVSGEDGILWGCINKTDLEDSDKADKRIIRKCVKDISTFDRIVTHYGKRFDIPFLRTRALMCKEKFPTFKELYHTDTYDMAKRLLCLHSRRQGAIAEAVQGKDIKTRITSKYWVAALQGRPEALRYILDHNKKDVIQLEGNYTKLLKYYKVSNTSI